MLYFYQAIRNIACVCVIREENFDKVLSRMDELGIDMNDLQTLHNNYLKRISHENKQ